MLKKSASRNLFAVLFAVLTVGVMTLFYNIYEPWQPVGPELIPDGSFSTPAATNVWSGWNQWTRLVPDGGYRGSPGVVLTTSSNEHGILRFTVYDLTNIPAFRVSMHATAHGIAKGQEGYDVPRAIFFYHNVKAKSLFRLHHGVMDIRQDADWTYYKDFFPVPAGAADARLHIQNLGNAGVMQIDDISIIPVCERRATVGWKIFFGTLWITAFAICLFALRPWTRRYGFPIMVTLALIMTGIVLPGKFMDDSIEKSIHAVKNLRSEKAVSPAPVQAAKVTPVQTAVSKSFKPKEDPVLPGTGVEKTHIIGHFTLFSLLAFLSALSWLTAPSIKRVLAVFAGLIFFAAATEVLQFIPADRSAGLSDLSIDTIGMTGAVAAVFILRSIQRLITRINVD